MILCQPIYLLWKGLNGIPIDRDHLLEYLILQEFIYIVMVAKHVLARNG